MKRILGVLSRSYVGILVDTHPPLVELEVVHSTEQYQLFKKELSMNDGTMIDKESTEGMDTSPKVKTAYF